MVCKIDAQHRANTDAMWACRQLKKEQHTNDPEILKKEEEWSPTVLSSSL